MKGRKKIALALLAAGDSRRFGGNKLLTPIEGQPMYRHIAEQIHLVGRQRDLQKILVTQYETIAEDLQQKHYQVVINRESTLGISHSIHLALEQVDQQTDAVCFCVCDQPWLRASSLLAFLAAWEESEKGLGCLCSKGELGNPAVFSKEYWTALKAVMGDRGGKGILKSHPEDLYLYEVEDPKELKDVDVPTES